MDKIRLTQGKVALVDAQDYEWLNQWKWCTACWRQYLNYATRRESGKQVFMHRVILGVLKGQEVDHINGNGLDNRRENLRICTRSQNQHNRKATQGTSKYKGVSWSSRDKRWRAKIKVFGVSKMLGNFIEEKDAARAYDEGAIEYHGEFARTNKMLGLL